MSTVPPETSWCWKKIPLPDAFHEAVSTLEICLPETLQALPDDERWLIEESDLNRRPQQRLADELGITLTAFKSRLLRARKAPEEDDDRTLPDGSG
jgi:RNA polymerase sigma-70 factor (ECF subfamily)